MIKILTVFTLTNVFLNILKSVFTVIETLRLMWRGYKF